MWILLRPGNQAAFRRLAPIVCGTVLVKNERLNSLPWPLEPTALQRTGQPDLLTRVFAFKKTHFCALSESAGDIVVRNLFNIIN